MGTTLHFYSLPILLICTLKVYIENINKEQVDVQFQKN